MQKPISLQIILANGCKEAPDGLRDPWGTVNFVLGVGVRRRPQSRSRRVNERMADLSTACGALLRLATTQ